MPSRLDDINEQRKQKLERLRGRGINPYPNRYQQTHTTQEAIAQLEATEVQDTASQAKNRVSGQETKTVSVAPLYRLACPR